MKNLLSFFPKKVPPAGIFIIGFAMFGICVGSCTIDEDASVKFDSAHSIALEASIDQAALIVSNLASETEINRQIEAQLKFSVGQLNAKYAVANLSTLTLQILAKNVISNTESEVAYSAGFLVSWPKEIAVPSSIELMLPDRASYSDLEKFFAAYGIKGSLDHQCMEGSSEAVSSTFWYYFRPLQYTCILGNSDQFHELAIKATVNLSFSPENTEGKYPEYEKIWEDNQLVVTALFGKAKSGNIDIKTDPGIYAYQQFYLYLLKLYGKPITTNLEKESLPDANNDNVSVQFVHNEKTIDIQMFLVDSLWEIKPEMKEQYNRRTLTSDFVSYSGHSGYGENIRLLAKLGQFQKGQYQIFLVNGCDTFAYVDESLKKAHAKVNPGFGEDKYIDVITNAMPSFFSNNAFDNVVMIENLLEQKLDYRQILAQFPQNQRAAVVGEQDNNWPLPFE